ncbi:MAG: MarR family transcriptional regulator [Gammaproteobacteria bacterium]|nr:MarR family transcriptional regulator [Gammaproteobacteria bacterium]
MTGHRIDGRVMAGLVQAVDWFDNSLQNVLASKGFQPLHRTHSMIMVHIAGGIESPADIAREMGLTRQNVHHMAKTLISDGLIEQAPDPADPRRTIYQLAGSATEIRSVALETLSRIESVLAARIGAGAVDDLRRALAAEWGAEIQDEEDMAAALGESRSNAAGRA